MSSFEKLEIMSQEYDSQSGEEWNQKHKQDHLKLLNWVDWMLLNDVLNFTFSWVWILMTFALFLVFECLQVLIVLLRLEAIGFEELHCHSEVIKPLFYIL